MSQQFLFKNLLEPSFEEIHGGCELLVEGDTVKELNETPIKAADATVIDGNPLKDLALFGDQGKHPP